jgi:hypothetical protein
VKSSTTARIRKRRAARQSETKSSDQRWRGSEARVGQGAIVQRARLSRTTVFTFFAAARPVLVGMEVYCDCLRSRLEVNDGSSIEICIQQLPRLGTGENLDQVLTEILDHAYSAPCAS